MDDSGIKAFINCLTNINVTKGITVSQSPCISISLWKKSQISLARAQGTTIFQRFEWLSAVVSISAYARRRKQAGEFIFKTLYFTNIQYFQLLWDACGKQGQQSCQMP